VRGGSDRKGREGRRPAPMSRPRPAARDSRAKLKGEHRNPVAQVFGLFDQDHDGLLSQVEYCAYSEAVEGKVTDAARFEKHCRLIGAGEKGINLEKFRRLYEDPKLKKAGHYGKAGAELASLRSMADEGRDPADVPQLRDVGEGKAAHPLKQRYSREHSEVAQQQEQGPLDAVALVFGVFDGDLDGLLSHSEYSAYTVATEKKKTDSARWEKHCRLLGSRELGLDEQGIGE
jgi:hypothetical protein